MSVAPIAHEPPQTIIPPSLGPSLEGVLRLAARGWKILPCAPRSKVARLPGWTTQAASDPDTIRAWAIQHPGCNWAVATGAGSGVFVLDIDGEVAMSAIQDICRKHGDDWPRTLTAITGREHGRHLYFRYPEGEEIGKSIGRIGDKLDILGAKSYAMVPPSIHESGRPYEWEDLAVPVAHAPEWLLQAVRTASASPSKDRLLPRYFARSAETQSSPIYEGNRNNTLFKAASSLRGRGIEPGAIGTTLLEMNSTRCDPPLEVATVLGIAESAARYPAGPNRNEALPLAECVAVAIEDNLKANTSAKKWRSALWSFIRRLKGRTEFEERDAMSAAKMLDDLLGRSAEGSADPWEHHFGGLHEDPRSLFVKEWEKVRVPENSSPLQVAYLAACELPLIPLDPISALYAHCISLVGHLQRASPGQAIVLAQSPIAALLGCQQTTVSAHLDNARRMGLLTLQKTSRYTEKRAAEYIFASELWDWETGKQIGLLPDCQTTKTLNGTGSLVAVTEEEGSIARMEDNGRKGRT